MTTTTPKRIHIVDDDPADARQLLSILTTSGYEVEVSSDGDAFVADLAALDADLVIVDLRMPGIGGLEVLKRLTSAHPGVPAIMVSGRGDIRAAVKAVKFGAADFLEKPVDPEELVEVVKRCAGRMREPAGRWTAAITDVWSKVSPREAEVLERLLKGERNKQIAHEMQIAERTVETHRANMMKRLGVTSFADLIRLGIASGERPRTS